MEQNGSKEEHDIKKVCRGILQSESIKAKRVTPTRQCKGGNLHSDDAKPRGASSHTVRNMAAGEPARKFTDGQQVFGDFLR